jgi:hypothetical protein
MTTTAQNPVDALNRNQSRVQLPVTTNLTVNEGDFVYWDGTNYTVTPITNKSQVTGNPQATGGGTFLGVALQSNADLIYPGDSDTVGVLVLVRGVVWANTTAADTYGWFTAVTIGATAQTITSTGVTTTIGSSFNVIGYTLPPVATTPRPNQATPAPETLTGAAGVRVQVVLAPTHPYAAAV